jgi:predicted nucleic acid-binding protein
VNAVFLDTVGLIAIWDKSDQWHGLASKAYATLRKASIPLLTTSYVLLECGNAAARRPYRNRVVMLRKALVDAELLVKPTAEDIDAAWRAFERGDGSQAGIVDHVSFVVMRRLGITKVFTHNAHFRAAGFETLF